MLFLVASLPLSFDVPADSGAPRAGAPVAEALAAMHKGEETYVCLCVFLPILTRCDLDAQWNLYGKGIGDGGAAAIARVLASNRTVTLVCAQHRVPAWGQPCGTHAHR